MAALNYILYTEFEGKFQYGPPVHSVYKRRGGPVEYHICQFHICHIQRNANVPAGLRTDVKMSGGCTSESLQGTFCTACLAKAGEYWLIQLCSLSIRKHPCARDVKPDQLDPHAIAMQIWCPKVFDRAQCCEIGSV